jgi:hypothetical protein
MVACQLIEHDSGNIMAAKQAYRDAIDNSVKTLGTVGGVAAEELDFQTRS